MHFLILLAHILGQIPAVELGLRVHDFVAVLCRTDHFLEHAHLVDHIVLQARVAEGMFTLGDSGELFHIVLPLTNLASLCLHDVPLEHFLLGHIFRWLLA